MSQAPTRTGLQLRSTVRAAGELELSLVATDIPAPASDEVVIRMEAAPLNPSDISLLLGPADLNTLKPAGTAEHPTLVAEVPPQFLPGVEARLDQPLPIGNEGAGTVVEAGANVRDWLGRTVSVFGGATYAEYRTAKIADCMMLPPGTTAAEGASWFVNPLTALGMIETMRRKRHTALVHTAAASNLGQMLNRICLADGIGLVNIVRSPAQAELLRAQGARFVCDSPSPGFTEELTAAVAATRATLAFDAIGAGTLASDILAAMEVALRRGTAYSLYGTPTHKQVYIYGRLSLEPTILTGAYGMAWGVGGFLLTPFLQKVGNEEAGKLRARVAAELKTTFASHYTRTISLRDALDPETIRAYNRKATGEKFLINPSL